MNLSESNIKSFLNSIPSGVKVVAVSKTKPLEDILAVYSIGHKIFGENRVQELKTKFDELPKDIEWHLIGHLQTNKIKYIIGFVHMIHSVDSLKLLISINTEAKKHNRIVDVLMQVYIATEETKFGLDTNELLAILKSPEIKNLNNVRLCGLMGIASFTDDMKQVRQEFKHLKEIFTLCKREYFAENESFTELSMGMSGDYNIAVEEGATIIRVGSLIFGERNYL